MVINLVAIYGKPSCQAIAKHEASFHARRDLVAWIDSLLARHGFSARSRRAVDMVRIWRKLAHGEHVRFTIRDTCGRGVVLQIETV